LRVDLFDFNLPEENIALRPADPRDSAKMLIVGDKLQDKQVSDLADLLEAGDALVFNNTRVIPTFVKGAKKLKPKDRIRFGVGAEHCGSLDCKVIDKHENGDVELQFDLSGAAFDQKLAQIGTMPSSMTKVSPNISSRCMWGREPFSR